MKTSYAEQISALEATLHAKAQQQQAIMTKATAEGRSTTDEEGQQFDELELEISDLEKDLTRLRVMEKRMVSAAKAVDGGSTAAASASRGAPTIIVRSSDKDEAFQGQNFVRKIIAKAAAQLQGTHATDIAIKRWGQTNPTLVNIIKANEVPGGGTGSGEWGSELVQSDTRYTGDFIDFLYAATVFDKLPLRVAPANVTIKGQDGTATGYWVGESKAIPVSKADFMDMELKRQKVAALAVVSNELILESSPDAEMLVRDSLVAASAQRVDQTFLSTSAAVAGVSPAGILNGLTPITASGVTADHLRADIKALYAGFIAAKNASDIHLVMNTALAKSISLMVNAFSQSEFPGMGAKGGNLLGDVAVTGDNVNSGHLIALKPNDIYKIGDRGVEVSISREATIEQNSVPLGATDTPVGVTEAFTSMFQSDSTAIKVVRPISFAKRRASAVAYVASANYG